MKKLYFLLFTFLIMAASFGQSILLIEEFNTSDVPQYSTSMSEQIVTTSAYFTRTDGTNIATPISFLDGEHYFAVQDIDTSPMSSPATMLFNDINIATFTNLTFLVGLAEHDAADGMEDWDNDDFVHFEYQIDNSGTWKNLVWVENGGTADSAPQIDTDFNGVGDGDILVNTFDIHVLFDIPDTGSLIDIRVTFGGLTEADEDFAMDFLALFNDFNLFPTVDITSPTALQVFPSGTTSVNIDYIITGTPERVDIYVNNVLTSDIGNESGSFPIATSDGQSYDVEMSVFFGGGVEVDGDFVTFNVDSPLGIGKNEILGLTIFPNPTSLGYVNISSRINTTIDVSVFDIIGKQVIRGSVINDKFNLPNLNAGIYIMKLTQNNATSTRKLIIK